LRELRESDAPELLELHMHNREHLRPFDPTRPGSFFTLEGQRAEMRQAEADRAADRGYRFAIVDASDGRVVGVVALSNVVRGVWQNATLGYWVDRDHGGRGFATDAVRRALQFAFGTAALHRVQAAVMPRNAPSIRVVEKAGLRFESVAPRYLQINGVWEDHNIYAMTAEEWPPPA
jgi:ribosomal-protein-alanine N-acetyltransferase